MYYQRNVRDYGDNVHEYNQNMATYLALLSNHVSSSTNTRRPIRNTHRNTLNSVWSNYLGTYDRHYEPRREFNMNNVLYEPVVVRPNSLQIENATEYIQFTNELTHNACPITLEPFQEGERVCRIIHCGHIFKESGIREWFQRNVRCPVCRYDIRTYVRPVNSREDEGESVGGQEETEFDDVIRELNEELNQDLNGSRTEPTPSTSSATTASASTSTSPLTNILATAVRSFINNELQYLPENSPFNELIYTFDIPIDISGGRYRI